MYSVNSIYFIASPFTCLSEKKLVVVRATRVVYITVYIMYKLIVIYIYTIGGSKGGGGGLRGLHPPPPQKKKKKEREKKKKKKKTPPPKKNLKNNFGQSSKGI